MAEKTDLRKVQAALDRAAKNAVSGPKEARAGRFAPGAAKPANSGAGHGAKKAP